MLILQNVLLQNYFLKLIFLIIGCFILGFGVYLELVADVAMLSGDAFIRAIAQTAHKSYGGTKIVSDISMTAAAAILCLVFFGTLTGVREGTVIAAIIVGFIIKLYPAFQNERSQRHHLK